MTGGIYSVGYEGMTLDGLVARLTGAHVEVLVDVRLNPISRKAGFSRTKLCAGLAAAGIDYVHERQLGNPPDNRESFRRGDGQHGRARMRAILLHDAADALDRLVERASASRVAVLCVERDHTRCHRDVITDMAVEKNAAIDVLHIV